MREIVFFLFWLSPCLYGQTTFNHQYTLGFPYKVFTSVLPTDSCFYARGIITDTTGGTYKVGNLFVKLNLDGEVEYQKKLATAEKSYEAWLGDLAPTADGGFVDACLAKDSTFKGTIIRYNNVGDTLFTSEFLHPYYPDEYFMFVAGLMATPDNEYFFLSGIDGDTSDSYNGDIYLLKFDSTGALLENYIYEGSPTEVPRSMLLEPDGGVIVGAKSSNTGQVWQDYYSRAHVFKISSPGEIEWEYFTPANQLFDMARDMVRAPDGGLVIASGKGIEHDVNISTSILQWHPYLFKLNAAHELEWGREFRGARHAQGTSAVKVVSALDGSGYVATGRIIEDYSIGVEVGGSWIFKASPEGDSLWARYYSFFDDILSFPHPWDLKATSDGGYVIVGETRPRPPDSPQLLRAWMMKVDEHGCLIPGCHLLDGVEETDISQAELAIYPNPARDFLNFQLRGTALPKGAQFRIVDITGKTMKAFKAGNLADTYVVSVGSWPGGVYFLQYLMDEKVLRSKKFIKH
ncbi:MAG: T9SS type A sorting domain-containing protein [Lewinellaceae bacterium]|nr:T9SS type A sorting domain-containing protein [Lewinellaceae bacterium]